MKKILIISIFLTIIAFSFMAVNNWEDNKDNELDFNELKDDKVLFSGPIKPGTDEKLFRETGYTREVNQ